MINRTNNGYYDTAREGRYFRALNAAMGTGIAMGVQTTFSDTANVLCLLQPVSKEICMDYFRLICTAAGGGTTSSDLAIVTDTVPRFSSGGTGLTVKNVQHSSSVSSDTTASFGVITAIAASAKRQLAHLKLKTQAAPCWTVGDEVFVRFGGGGDGGSGLTSGTASSKFHFNAGPIIGSGGGSILFHMWNTANAATPPSWEVEIGWWEV